MTLSPNEAYVGGYVRDSDGRLISHEGRGQPIGARQVFTIAQPAAGAEIGLTLPTTSWWRFYCFATFFQTSATVINRYVGVRYLTPASVDIGLKISSSIAATAGQANELLAVGRGGIGAASGVSGTFVQLNWPDILIEPGGRIETQTFGIQAGDQWGAIAATMTLQPCSAEF